MQMTHLLHMELCITKLFQSLLYDTISREIFGGNISKKCAGPMKGDSQMGT